jgi:mono/diheme cytochrome c family protein
MKIRALVLLLAVATPALGQNDSRQAPTILEDPARVGVGRTYAVDALTAARGEARLLVVAFTQADCPLSKLYRHKIDRLAKQYDEKDVRFLVVTTDDETLGPLLEPARTTEAYLLDAGGVLRYRGAIDDQYGIGYQRDEATKTYLTDAIAALLASKEPPVAATEAPGCRVSSARARPNAPANVTFHKDVQPIFQKRCVVCHRPGEIGPFSLLTYDKARSNSQEIRAAVSERRMPPWHADPKTGEFVNDRRLSDTEIATIASWVDAGTPEGDPRDAPPPREFSEGWQIGTPDLVLTIPKPYRIKAEGTIPYHYAEVPTEIAEDRWVQAIEVRPGARAAVHHVLVFIRTKKLGDQQPLDGGLLYGYFGIMVPGENAMIFPDGMAKKLPGGARLIFQIHYAATGKVLEDQTSIGLVFAKKPVAQEVITRGVVNTKIKIPAGAADHEETATYTFEHDAKILSFLPHTHVRGKAFKYVAIAPGADGEEVLLDVPEYDFNWQTCYRLKEPRSVKKGTKIKVYVKYDNSASNPANPDPTKVVKFGQQTWQEMLIGYVDFVKE